MGTLRELHRSIVRTVAEGGELTSSQKLAVEEIVARCWPGGTLSDARLMVEMMEIIPSTKWLNFVLAAERRRIVHWHLLLEHANRLYERAADALAEEDGLTFVP